MNIKLKLRNCKYFGKKMTSLMTSLPKQCLVKLLVSREKNVDIHNR